MPLFLLGHGQFGGKGADLLLGLDTFGDICRENGDPACGVYGSSKLINRKLNRYTASTNGLQAELSSHAIPSGVFKKCLESTLLVWQDQVLEPNTNQLFAFNLDHLTKTAV